MSKTKQLTISTDYANFKTLTLKTEQISKALPRPTSNHYAFKFRYKNQIPTPKTSIESLGTREEPEIEENIGTLKHNKCTYSIQYRKIIKSKWVIKKEIGDDWSLRKSHHCIRLMRSSCTNAIDDHSSGSQLSRESSCYRREGPTTAGYGSLTVKTFWKCWVYHLPTRGATKYFNYFKIKFLVFLCSKLVILTKHNFLNNQIYLF